MKLESITVENYRQFEKVKLTFDDSITILAGANNSGKTSLITLIKNIFSSEKNDYSTSDIPAKNIQEWIGWAYPIFQDYIIKGETVDSVDKELVERVIPKCDKTFSKLMNTTSVKIHVSYNAEVDDIKLFADYIMDLDEDKSDFYFMFKYEIMRSVFVRVIMKNFLKIKSRFEEIEEDKEKARHLSDAKLENNILKKERYLRQLIVSLYVESMIPTVYFCDKDYRNKCKFTEIKEFRQLFHLCFIKASRPLDDDASDRSHLLSKQMIKMLKSDDSWNELIKRLPDELLRPIQDKEIDKTVRDTSLMSLKEAITALEGTNGGRSGELMLDMQITEDDISDLLQRITTATYNVNGYYLGESSQGLGYSNLIYIHLQLKEYEKNVDKFRINMFFLEEPESHMHPQMQQVFTKYLLDYYRKGLQGLITTHSNEIVRVAGISHLRVIRHVGKFKSNLYDLSLLLKELKESSALSDHELANFFDWFFEIGYSEIVFADKAIFYEGDTERLLIKKAMTLNNYQKLNQQYIAFIQVGGAYAKNYEKLIRVLGIKSLIITDIDYEKDKIKVDEIKTSNTTNATIKHFYSLKHPNSPTVSDLYTWMDANENVVDNLIFICFQGEKDGYARTLEEAMLSKLFSINIGDTCKKSEWTEKKEFSKLYFSIPNKKDGNSLLEDSEVSIRDILSSTAKNKTDFMYSVILNRYVEIMMPEYIDGGLKWLME